MNTPKTGSKEKIEKLKYYQEMVKIKERMADYWSEEDHLFYIENKINEIIEVLNENRE